MKKISIIDLSNSAHFKEIIDGFLAYKSKEFEFVPYKTNKSYKTDYVIVLGANRRPDLVKKLAAEKNKTIIYNLEQLRKNYNWLSQEYIEILSSYPVLEYSQMNLQFFEQKRIKAVYLPIPIFDSFELTNYENLGAPYGETAFDLLMFGMDCQRRRDVWKTLNNAGISVIYATDLWGLERYKAIKNCAGVLNIHANEGGYLETTRLNYCIANGFNVISESSQKEALSDVYGKYVHFFSSGSFVEQTRAFLHASEHNRANRLKARGDLKEILHPRMIDGAISEIINSEKKRTSFNKKSADVINETPSIIQELKQATPEKGLSFHDVKRIGDAVFGETSRHANIEQFASIILNKFPHFPQHQKDVFWKDFLVKLGSKRSIRSKQILSAYRGLIQEGIGDVNYAAIIKESHNIDSLFIERLELMVNLLSNEKLESLSVTICENVRSINNDVAIFLLKAAINALFAKGYSEAVTRLSIFAMKENIQLDANFIGKIASHIYGAADMLTAIKVAKKACAAGITSPGMISLAKAKIAKYPSEYRNALSAYTDSLREMPSTSRVLNSLNRNVDPALFADVHAVVPYGNQLGETYGINFSSQDLKGAVFASDKLIQFRAEYDVPKTKAIAIISHYNESDILRWSVDSLYKQGIQAIILDNWSTSDHFEKALLIAKTYGSEIIKFPDEKPATYEWRKILNKKASIAERFNGYWVIHQDADEIRLSSLPGFEFRAVLDYAEFLGFNALDHMVMNVRPTEDNFNENTNPFMVYSHFEFGNSDVKNQIKTWKQGKTIVDLASTGGHSVSYLNRKIFPLKQYLFHFPIRSIEQGTRKIFQERLNRFSPEEKALGWHMHYDEFREKSAVELFKRDELLPLFDFRQLSSAKILRQD